MSRALWVSLVFRENINKRKRNNASSLSTVTSSFYPQDISASDQIAQMPSPPVPMNSGMTPTRHRKTFYVHVMSIWRFLPLRRYNGMCGPK